MAKIAGIPEVSSHTSEFRPILPNKLVCMSYMCVSVNQVEYLIVIALMERSRQLGSNSMGITILFRRTLVENRSKRHVNQQDRNDRANSK